jgi:hypothetical protein
VGVEEPDDCGDLVLPTDESAGRGRHPR